MIHPGPLALLRPLLPWYPSNADITFQWRQGKEEIVRFLFSCLNVLVRPRLENMGVKAMVPLISKMCGPILLREMSRWEQWTTTM